jgi:RNA polymerase sigma-70 factor (ECF subfamily)
MAQGPSELADLLSTARTGSPEALGRALEACRGYLLLIAEQELDADLRAKGGASDLVQETFLKAHRHFNRFQGCSEEELRAWLRRVLLNNLADFRALYREAAKRQISRETPLGSNGSSAGSAQSLAANTLTPSRDAIQREQAKTLDEILDQLPEDYRQVLHLRHREECSFAEIAQRMNRTANAARKLWARAVERFQQEWETQHAGQQPPTAG